MTTTLPHGVNEQLETLRATIRGCDAALINSDEMEKWEIKEYQQAREEASEKLRQWEANIELAMR